MMSFDFAEAGKRFETTIPVPELSIASIRNRVRAESARHRARALIACAAAAVIVLGSGTVIAAMYGGVRVWLSGDKAAVAMRSFTFVRDPNAADLRRVVADATFPVVLPAGIPKGMHMEMLFFSPADHPTFIEVRYRNSVTDARSGQFLLFDSSTVTRGPVTALPNGEKPPVANATHWTVGRETIVVPEVPQRAQMKEAMSRMTPSESLRQTLPLLYRITILAGQDRLADAAEAIAPSEGRSVLVDREALGQVARLAQEHAALLFVRTITMDNLPTAHGKPDFAHQSSRQTEELAVSADGVRAIAAVLASKACGSGRGGFTCEILINERSGRDYWVWTMPLNASKPPAQYSVDSKTFRVAPVSQ